MHVYMAVYFIVTTQNQDSFSSQIVLCVYDLWSYTQEKVERNKVKKAEECSCMS